MKCIAIMSCFCRTRAAPCGRVCRTGLCRQLGTPSWSCQSYQTLPGTRTVRAWPRCWWWAWRFLSGPAPPGPSTRSAGTRAGRSWCGRRRAPCGRWCTCPTSRRLRGARVAAWCLGWTWTVTWCQSLQKPLELLCLLVERAILTIHLRVTALFLERWKACLLLSMFSVLLHKVFRMSVCFSNTGKS